MVRAGSYGLSIDVDATFERARERAIAALKDEGFGVLTEVDVKATMKQKLDVEFRKYVILGACNPPLAHRALSAETEIGLLLPCNLIVYETGPETSVVAAIDPEVQLGKVGRADLAGVASEVRSRLVRVLEATAAGRPVLASKIPGNRWVVLGNNGDHPMGLLYDGDDPEDFLKKALILIDEEEVRRKFGEAGIRRAASLPTPDEEAGRLARVYEMAMHPGGKEISAQTIFKNRRMMNS